MKDTSYLNLPFANDIKNQVGIDNQNTISFLFEDSISRLTSNFRVSGK